MPTDRQDHLVTEQMAGELHSSTRLSATVFVGERSYTLGLPTEGVVVLGRSSDVELPLPSASVSRRHARLVLHDDGARATVADLGSRNGTLVNGLRVDGERAVQHGDEVSLGDVRLLFLRASAVPPSTIVYQPRALFQQTLASEVAAATQAGTPLWLFALQLPEPWDGATRFLRALESLPRVGHYGILGDTVIGVAAPRTRDDEALEIEEMFVKAMGEVGLAPACGVAGLRRGASATDLIDLALEKLEGAPPGAGDLLGPVALDPVMVTVLEQAKQLAASPLHLLLVGETGAGKEVLARFVHEASGRTGPLVCVNAAALPDALLESELFGHERGAFSGAAQAKVGLIEAAHKGTLFLDEIGELPLTMQAKLLRVLEDYSVRRVGATTERKVDVRFVSATNRDLEEEVRERRFRQDLLFRLNAGMLRVPPLRERRTEIPALAALFLRRAATARGIAPPAIGAAAHDLLSAYAWPGNVRELRNAMDRAFALSGGATIAPKHLPESIASGLAAAPMSARGVPTVMPPAATDGAGAPIRETMAQYERDRIVRALDEAGGNQTRAAELLGIPRRTLAYRMRRLGLLA